MNRDWFALLIGGPLDGKIMDVCRDQLTVIDPIEPTLSWYIDKPIDQVTTTTIKTSKYIGHSVNGVRFMVHETMTVKEAFEELFKTYHKVKS